MAENTPTPRAKVFMDANSESPVIAGYVLEPHPTKPPKGISYTLEDGRRFRLGVKDAQSMPMPRWKEVISD